MPAFPQVVPAGAAAGRVAGFACAGAAGAPGAGCCAGVAGWAVAGCVGFSGRRRPLILRIIDNLDSVALMQLFQLILDRLSVTSR